MRGGRDGARGGVHAHPLIVLLRGRRALDTEMRVPSSRKAVSRSDACQVKIGRHVILC